MKFSALSKEIQSLLIQSIEIQAIISADAGDYSDYESNCNFLQRYNDNVIDDESWGCLNFEEILAQHNIEDKDLKNELIDMLNQEHNKWIKINVENAIEDHNAITEE